MPLTKSRTITPAEAVDLATIMRVQDHPLCRELAREHAALRHRLGEIQAQIREAHMQRRALESHESFESIVRRRAILDQVATLENQAAEVERTLATLAPALAEAAAAATGELRAFHEPLVQAAEAAELAAMEAYATASATRAAAARHAMRACGAPCAIQGVAVDMTIRARARAIRQKLTARQARRA